MKDHRVDDRKNGCVRTDAKRKSGYGCGCEAAISPQAPQGVL
jgi:hypothetical protein